MSLVSYYCGSPGATGQIGRPGAMGATGATGGTGATGNNGSITTFGNFKAKGMTDYNGIPQHIDQYFNVWWYVGGGWNKVSNIIGPDGDIGATGGTGEIGGSGSTGETGDIGPKGSCRVGNNINMVRITNNGTNSTTIIILYPYLYMNASNYPHTLKVSYKLSYNNTSSSIRNYSILVYNQNGLLTKFTPNVPPNTIGVESNMDTIAGLTSTYYYCAWLVSDPSLQLTLDNITMRTIN